MEKNLIFNLQNEGINHNLDKLLIDCVVSVYYNSLLHDIKTNNISIIDNNKYNLVYDDIYGAEIRLKLSKKLNKVLKCNIKHSTKKLLVFKKDIFHIVYQ